jgi:hypothetical protein
MARIRYNVAEARQEAIRLAAAYVATLPGALGIELSDASSASTAPRSDASKHPVIWCVRYSPIRFADAVIDGGELLLDVNIETKTVRQWLE